MKKRLGVIMDPITGIKPYKDTTLALLLAAQKFNYDIYYMEMSNLSLVDGSAFGKAIKMEVYDSNNCWFKYLDSDPAQNYLLSDFDCILMRKDPPFDMEYVFATYILEKAQLGGALVVNDPRSIRDCNEKMFTSWFPDLCPPTLVTRCKEQLHQFIKTHEDIVVKPLDGMGGSSVFRVQPQDSNANVIFETLTKLETNYCMAQKYIPQIESGDKRVIMVNGQPIPYALARIPAKGELRGNLAAGGQGVPQLLSEDDLHICKRVGPELIKRGLIFVGLDVIGDKLTEINVTSPTCAREIDAFGKIKIGEILMAAVEEMLSKADRS
jgi:glutathione synthase